MKTAMTTLARITCSNAPEYSSKAAQLVKDVAADPKMMVFHLFLGEKLESTGRSWCPDCVRAEPIINAEFETFVQQLNADGESRRLVLLACNVSRTDLRSTDFALKTDPNVMLTCVPTLMVPAKGRLGDADCQSAEKVRQFLAQSR